MYYLRELIEKEYWSDVYILTDNGGDYLTNLNIKVDSPKILYVVKIFKYFRLKGEFVMIRLIPRYNYFNYTWDVEILVRALFNVPIRHQHFLTNDLLLNLSKECITYET